MTRALILLAALLPAACAANDPLPPPASAAEAECRREGQNAPAVKDAYQRINTGENITARTRVLGEVAEAERLAYLRCLRGKGLAPPGGVERVRPRQ